MADGLFGDGNSLSAFQGFQGLEDGHDDEQRDSDDEQNEGSKPKRGRKAGAKNKAKAKAKGEKKNKEKKSVKGKAGGDLMMCEMCDEEKGTDEFAINHGKCLECKRSWDSLTKMAKRQGHQKWYASIVNGPVVTRKKVLKEFKLKSGAADLKKKKRGFQIMTLVEKFRVESATDKLGQGKFMWQDEAIEFWQKNKGGAHSKEEATEKWEFHKSDPVAFVQDQLGPAKNPLRIRVPKGDYSNFRTTVAREKELCLLVEAGISFYPSILKRTNK
jgi:hypothetical protein